MVSEKIQGLNPGKSPGPDGWHPFPLKQLCDMIKVPLAILFQKSLKGRCSFAMAGSIRNCYSQERAEKLFRKLQSSQHNVDPLQTHGIYC